MTLTIGIEGMSCGHCAARVRKALESIEGITATVDLTEKKATVTSQDTIDEQAIRAIIRDAGYTVTE